MTGNLIELLKCIYCGHDKLIMREESGANRNARKLVCEKCNAEYSIIQGIPVLIRSKHLLNEQGVRIFHEYADRYDSWFFSDKGRILFKNELKALRKLLENVDLGASLEIGVGTGEFAQALGISYGLDPAFNALLKAKERGIKCVQGIAEELPFRDSVFDSVFMIVTICYVKDITKALREANRVLRRDGNIVIGFINKDSSWGKLYLEKKRKGHLFYGPARFYSLEEVKDLLGKNGFEIMNVVTTLYQSPLEKSRPEEPVEGVKENAGFITILAKKLWS